MGIRVDNKHRNKVLDKKEIELCGVKYVVELKLCGGNGLGVFPRAIVRKPVEKIKDVVLEEAIRLLEEVD